MGQGSKYCLVAIGRLQVRKGSGPFSSQMRASHHKEQWPGGLRASSELAAPVFVGFPVSHSTGGKDQAGSGEEDCECVSPPCQGPASVRPDTPVLSAKPTSAHITPVSSPGVHTSGLQDKALTHCTALRFSPPHPVSRPRPLGTPHPWVSTLPPVFPRAPSPFRAPLRLFTRPSRSSCNVSFICAVRIHHCLLAHPGTESYVHLSVPRPGLCGHALGRACPSPDSSRGRGR